MEQSLIKGLLNKILLISFVSLLSLQTSCATAPPDVPLCTEITITKGYCIYTISNKEFYVDEAHPWSITGKPEDAKTWWDLRITTIVMPYPSWVAIKTFIIKICKKSQECTDNIANWERSVYSLDDQVKQKLP